MGRRVERVLDDLADLEADLERWARGASGVQRASAYRVAAREISDLIGRHDPHREEQPS